MNYKRMKAQLLAFEMDSAQARIALEARRVKHAKLSGKLADASRVLEALKALDLLTLEYNKISQNGGE